MVRYVVGVVFVGMLLSGSVLFAQNQAPAAPSTAEPPEASPGEVKPAPASSVVVPGQPRLLPNLDAKSVEPNLSRATESTDPSQGIQQVQHLVPAPAAGPNSAASTLPTPTLLLPEPPTPTVKISVKGMEIAPTGQELTYRLSVTNSSDARAHNVTARCPVPRGAKLIKSLPEAKVDGRDLEWRLETLEPGAKREIEIVLKPDDGVAELAVVGKVQFEHGRYIKTRLANPTLEMKKVGAAQGVLHDPLIYKIIINNTGKVPVTDTQIVDTLPEGLEYVRETSHGATPASKVGPAPNQRTWTVGTLNPGETRTLEYRVLPRKTGEWISEATVTATGVQAKAGCNTAIQEAKVTLQVDGPKQDKATANQATPYLIVIHNTGTAILHNVRVNCAFPAEMRVAKASNSGHLFHDAVQWVLPKLEPNETKELAISLIAPSAGLREIHVSARADRGLEQRKKLSTSFEGVPALDWHTEGTAVAALGEEIVYTVTLKNPGSAPVKNVKIVADLPDQVEFRQAQPTFQRGQGTVFFNPLDIAPKETVTLKITTVAKKGGEARFQFEMNAEGMSAGPLKTSKSTNINPGAEPKKLDPSRIGAVPPPLEPKAVLPASGSDLVVPPALLPLAEPMP